MDNNVFRGLSYGVYLITAPDGERPTGCVANRLIQVTSSPATRTTPTAAWPRAASSG